MIQTTYDVAFVLIPDQDASVHTPEQNHLALISEHGTKLVFQLRDNFFVFDRVNLFHLAPAVILLDTN